MPSLHLVSLLDTDAVLFEMCKNGHFVLSMVDGSTSVNEILALSGMDPFDGARVVHRLLEAGIVEANP